MSDVDLVAGPGSQSTGGGGRSLAVVKGQWQSDLPGFTAQGTYGTFGGGEQPWFSLNPLYEDYTNIYGQFELDNARVNANWYQATFWNPSCGPDPFNGLKYWTDEEGYYNWYITTPGNQVNWVCYHYYYTVPASLGISPQFALSSPYPSSLTLPSRTPLATSGAKPVLYTFDRSGAEVGMTTATSVAPNGASATFPYPKTTAGQPLNPDLYRYNIVTGATAAAPSQYADGNFFTLASASTTYATPFGVDAIEVTETGTACGAHGGPCVPINSHVHYPIVTLYATGQVAWGNGASVLTVGTHPTVVRAFNITSVTHSNCCASVTVIQPQRALVVNTGSNSVSLIGLVTPTNIATVGVGIQPVDAQISADGSKAYIVNHGSGTVSVLNLSSYVVTSTISVGGTPNSIALDSNGNAWVGGNGIISEINLSTLSVSGTQAVTGNVTGIAYSTGQGQLITTIAPTNAASPTAAISYKPGTGYAQAFTVPAASSAYSTYSTSQLSPSLLWQSQLATGALVSSNVGNAIGMTVSGSQFSVTNLAAGGPLITGQLPGVIRSVAVEPSMGIVYMTVPDDNMVVTVPIPGPPVSLPSNPISPF